MKPLKVLSSHSEWFHSCGSEYTRVGQRFTVIFFSIITGDVIITFSGSVWSCSLNSKCHSLKPTSVQRSVSQEFSWSAFWRFAAENLWTSSEKEEKLKQMQMFLIPHLVVPWNPRAVVISGLQWTWLSFQWRSQICWQDRRWKRSQAAYTFDQLLFFLLEQLEGSRRTSVFQRLGCQLPQQGNKDLERLFKAEVCEQVQTLRCPGPPAASDLQPASGSIRWPGMNWEGTWDQSSHLEASFWKTEINTRIWYFAAK